MFNFTSINDFDRHIELSIPNYEGLSKVIRSLFLEYMPPNGYCLDVGCSTGKMLSILSVDVEGNYTGIDISDFTEHSGFEFIKCDCLEYLTTLEKNDVILSIFTLQFLGRTHREEVIKQLRRLVLCGSTLIIAEKVYSRTARVDSVLNREHIKQKRLSFTDTEILDKQEQLAGSMFCSTVPQMEVELSHIGDYEQVWQSYNFRAWVVK